MSRPANGSAVQPPRFSAVGCGGVLASFVAKGWSDLIAFLVSVISKLS
jgi:hypothetical protein